MSRLKFYNSATLDVTEDLREHLTYQQKSLYLVEEFKKVRRPSRRRFDVLVSSVGFPGEVTWEDLQVFAAYVPVRLLECFNSAEKFRDHRRTQASPDPSQEGWRTACIIFYVVALALTPTIRVFDKRKPPNLDPMTSQQSCWQKCLLQSRRCLQTCTCLVGLIPR